MVVEEAVNVSADVIGDIVSAVGYIGLWIQAIGLIVILWIIFHVVSLIFNRKRRKILYQIRGDLERIERKINKLLKK